jgi:hypothetical protein
MPMPTVLPVVRALIAGEISWAKVLTRYVVVNDGSMDADDDNATQQQAQPAAVSSAPTSVIKHGRAAFSRPTIQLAESI